MQKSEVIPVFQGIVEEFSPQLRQLVRSMLKGRDLAVFDRVHKDYYLNPNKLEHLSTRWYDLYHVIHGTLAAIKLVRSNPESVSPLIVSEISVHDVGYYSSLVDPASWRTPEARIIHQQESAGITAEILTKVGGFTASEIGRIVADVGSHDNGYLGIHTQNPVRLALRDADRAWVMHPISFYKDWASQKRFSLLRLLQSRTVSFYNSDDYVPWGRTKNPTRGDKLQQSQAPYTKLAREERDRQFRGRYNEIRKGIVNWDKDRFEAYFKVYAQRELRFEKARKEGMH